MAEGWRGGKEGKEGKGSSVFVYVWVMEGWNSKI